MRSKILIVIGITGIYFCSYFQRVGIPGTIFNEVQMDFLASAAAVAALSAIFLYVYGGMQLFAGLMADWMGAARTIVLGGLFLSAGAVFFPLSDTLFQLYVARFLVGLGASLLYVSIIKELSEVFDRRNLPFFLSLVLVFGYSGGLMGTLPLERMVSRMGWRPSLLLAGLLMDAFRKTAVITEHAIIYPAAAYRLIFLICLFLAAFACVVALFIREPAASKPGVPEFN